MSVDVFCDSVPEADVHCRLMKRGEFVLSVAVKGYDQCLGETGTGFIKRESQGEHGNDLLPTITWKTRSSSLTVCN